MARGCPVSLPILLPALCLAVLAPVPVLFAAPPQPDAPVLMIAPPWVDHTNLIHLAGGTAIGPQSAQFGSLAASPEPDFAVRLVALGAWAVRDGRLAARLCGAI